MKIMYCLVKICKKKKKMKLLKIKRKIKTKNKNKNDYINKEHVYKIFFFSDNMIRILSQGFGGVQYSKNISDNTNKIKSQDFGGNKYSKNIKDLDGVRTTILLKSSCYF